MPIEEEETRLLSFLEDYFHESERAREPFETDWDYNRLARHGEHMLVRRPYDPEVLRVVPERDANRKYSIDNQLQMTCRAFVGKACRIIPGIEILPGTNDRDDIYAAEVLKAYLDWWTEQNNMRQQYKRAWDLIPDCGTAVWRLRWDRLGGEDVYWCPRCGLSFYEGMEGEPCMLCQMKGIDAQMVRVRSGAVVADVLEDREFYPEPGVTEFCKMQRAHTKIALPVAKIREMFPDRGMLVHQEENLYKDRFLTYSTNLSQARFHTDYVEGYTRLYAYHEMPSGQYPDGMLAYVASDRILQIGPNPYARLLKRLPFFAFRGDRIPGSFYGVPVSRDAIPLQKEYNVLTTQVREWREHVVRPKMYVHVRSGIRMDRTDQTPGEIIPVKPGGTPPDYLRPPPLPNFVMQDLLRLKEAIREKFGLTAHDMGETTDSSGRSMALLAAQSNELFGPLLVENMPEWLALHKAVLVLAQAYDPPDKRWLAVGHDRLSMYAWGMCNIKAGWDVVAADEDSLSRNPELRRQQALEMLSQGVYTDQRTGMPNMRRFMMDAGLKQPGSGVDAEASEHTHAMLIPERIARGEPIMPALYDDANIHAQELLAWLRGRGRTAPVQIRQQVLDLWIKYAMAAMPAPDMQSYMPNPQMMQVAMDSMREGPPQQAGGGGPPQPGSPQAQQQPRQLSPGGAGALPQGQSGASKMIHAADRTGERAARGNRPHEG
jgi:hypothetical protein